MFLIYHTWHQTTYVYVENVIVDNIKTFYWHSKSFSVWQNTVQCYLYEMSVDDLCQNYIPAQEIHCGDLDQLFALRIQLIEDMPYTELRLSETRG